MKQHKINTEEKHPMKTKVYTMCGISKPKTYKEVGEIDCKSCLKKMPPQPKKRTVSAKEPDAFLPQGTKIGGSALRLG